MEKITVKNKINAPIEKVWSVWTKPEHIVNWNFASEDWHCPAAENELKAGGQFKIRMEARDGSFGFDFSGTYSEIIPHEKIAYQLEDGRKVEISFIKQNNETEVIEIFEAESQNPVKMQKDGWQAILDNFKKYVERL